MYIFGDIVTRAPRDAAGEVGALRRRAGFLDGWVPEPVAHAAQRHTGDMILVNSYQPWPGLTFSKQARRCGSTIGARPPENLDKTVRALQIHPMSNALSPPPEQGLVAAELAAMVAAVETSRANERGVPHEEMREWLTQIAGGHFDTKPPAASTL